MTHHGAYRTLTLLYPRAFRDRYRDDLTQAHDDLISDLGPARAWGRTGLDLLITVPRHRLETIMNNRNTNSGLHVVIGALIVLAAGVSLDIGIMFALIPLALAVILAVAQRTNLARSLRAPDTDLRRRRFVTAAVLGALSVLIVVVFMADIGTDDEWGDRLVVYNLAFMLAAASAVVHLVAGLLTKKSSPERTVHARST